MRVQEKWLRLTEETNALDYLENAARFIRDTEQSRLAGSGLSWHCMEHSTVLQYVPVKEQITKTLRKARKRDCD
jgi:hypothetical protein